MNDIWERYRDRPEDLVNEPVRFLMTVYATWVYTQMLQNLVAWPTTHSQCLTADLYDGYEDAFSADRIVRECEATRGRFMVRIANKRVRADDIFNAIVKNAWRLSRASHVCA